LRRIFGLRRGGYDTIVFFHHFTLRLGTLKFGLMARASGARRRIGLQNGKGWFLTESIPDGGFGAKHQAQTWLDLVTLLGADPSPRPARVAVADYALPDHAGPRVAVHAGGGGYSTARRWNPAHFARVADRLADERGAQIVLVGGPGDDSETVKAAMQHTPLDLTGQTSLPQLAGVLGQCDLFIGADGGVMNVAAASGVPVAAVFGPSNHNAWGPWTPGGRSAIIRSGVECSPCMYVGHGIGLRDGCAALTCMRLVTPEMVSQAANTLLDGATVPVNANAGTADRPERIHILGLPVDAITYETWLARIGEWIDAGERAHHVCTTNPEFMMVARKDPNFRNILRRADLCVPDGVGLLWAARRRGTPLPARVTGSDGVPIIAERAAREGWRLFLLGAGPGIAERAAERLCADYLGLQIAGTYGGSPSGDEEDAIVERVNASGADILFVAYGAPAQDKWIARNLPRLDVSMAMGVGGALDFVAGAIPRAPVWMRNLGIEWLYRLVRQPWRIKRMMRLPRFVLAVLSEGA
jgi:N-acetylglucosaminyldiphosphoundecaprenol N-acetyl-beta-D-mannosaminyltransferase